jgi:RNA polymerase sigma factor (sigma-70 family)
MNKQIQLNFINSKGIEKEVMFYIDEKTYNIIFSNEVTEEHRNRYLRDKYYEYVSEKHAERRYELYDEEKLEEIVYYKNKENYLEEWTNQMEISELKDAIATLNERQKLLIELIYFKGMSQKEVADLFGISKQAINKLLNKIYKKLREKIKKS